MLVFVQAYLQSRFEYFNNERGSVAAEYGLLIALIAIMIIAGATLIGQRLDVRFNQVGGAL